MPTRAANLFGDGFRRLGRSGSITGRIATVLTSSETPMRNALLIVAVVLFAVSLSFSASEKRYYSGINWGATNAVAAAGCAGFAVAGGLALLGAAVVHCFERRP